MLERFKKRPFLIWTVSIVGLVGAALSIVALTTKRKYDAIAATFDLSLLEKVPEGTLIYDRNWDVMGSIYTQNRVKVPLAEMAPALKLAAVAAEDQRFYSHSGADYIGIARAFIRNTISHSIHQGASSITQQLGRNTFCLTERSYQRKLVELALAWRLEKSLSKDQILERYLNLIYLGSGYYGVEAASKGYFGKPCSALNVGEAATLAGIIKSPNRLSPHKTSASAQKARNNVLGRMRETGVLSKADFLAAKSAPHSDTPSGRISRRTLLCD